MGTRMVRLDEDVYEWIKSRKAADETMSDAIARLTSDYTLLDFAGGWDEDDLEEFRERQRRAERADREGTEELLRRMGVDLE